jgi:hypothetical protein
VTADRCICDGAAYHNAEENRARHPFIVNPGCPVHAPVTADHTPERLSEPDKRLIGCTCWSVVPGRSRHARSCPGDAVERILAAHLADVEARLAAVEALCDEADEVPPLHSMIPRGCVRVSEVRAVLHPDPSGPVVGLETSGSWDQAPRRHPDPSEAI